jgi:hypothetical protein
MDTFYWMVDVGIDIDSRCYTTDPDDGTETRIPVVPLASIAGLHRLFSAYFTHVEQNPLVSNNDFGGFRCHTPRAEPAFDDIPQDAHSAILNELISVSTFCQVYSPFFKEVATSNGVKIPFKTVDALALVRGTDDPSFQKNLTKMQTQFQSIEVALKAAIASHIDTKHFPLRLEFRIPIDWAMTSLRRIFVNPPPGAMLRFKEVIHEHSIRIPADLFLTFLLQRLGGLCEAIQMAATRPMLGLNDYATRLQIPVMVISCRTLLSSINASQMDRSLQKWWNQGNGEHESAKLGMESYNAVYISNRYSFFSLHMLTTKYKRG